MTSPNPDETKFLTLAAKVLSGKATADERSRLDRSMQGNDAYKTTFKHMQALYQADRNDHLLESTIRVLCGTASAGETDEVRSLEKSDPALWRKFQFMRAMMTGLARVAEVDDTIQPEPMPERMRTALAARLRALNKGLAD